MADPASQPDKATVVARRDDTLGGRHDAADGATESAGQTGEMVGRYRIVRKLGEGGMAAVFLAEDAEGGRQVALKLPFVVPSEMETTIKRLKREAQAANAINHPNVCQVHEIGEHRGRIFLALQFIDGSSLAEWMQQTSELTAERAVEIVAKVARGVHAAHEAGILHRDLKAGNVMITTAGEPIVTDFGMARWTEAQHTVLTPSGAMVGTPGYMAPEQIMGENDRIGPASDVYSLGVVLYELLTGWMPFSGNLATLLGSIVSDAPPPLATPVPGIDPRLEAICLKSIAKAPNDRYASAAEFAQALENYQMSPMPSQSAASPASSSASGGKDQAGGLRGALKGLFSRKR
jgi:serine/threonine protein kinase